MRALLAVTGVLLLAGCSAAPAGNPSPDQPGVDVLAEIPHDPQAFTQGLELVDGVLYEGTGLEGESSIRTVDPATGKVEKKLDLPADVFGEGITVAGDTIWQITWQDGIAIRRDRATLAETGRVTYEGEGWGLCHDGSRLIMSDGSDRLTFRDVTTFDETGEVRVRDEQNQPLARINELECVGEDVYANIWQTDEIVRIDPATGKVTATFDLSGLLPEEDRAGADVLNGIAAIPDTDEFLVTGKLWPTMFRVRFVTGGT